ncbi:unnamed protein product [Spirodela intermedia]|uniref:Bifunctional inhibitor/plant lipid transfer protein/seed storage helical domain-containing protein n=1 Tax=Spirodela intermedia TaxID=51605 RepID=A0A7I8KK93_SPIIN|nr:unnamed protein product [Spirodela intermedia]
MKSFCSFGNAFSLILILLLMAARTPPAESVRCNPSEMLPCSGALFFSRPPSTDCCARLREQQPCFCQYLKNPSLSSYFSSQNARRVVTTCRVPPSRC